MSGDVVGRVSGSTHAEILRGRRFKMMGVSLLAIPNSSQGATTGGQNIKQNSMGAVKQIFLQRDVVGVWVAGAVFRHC